MADNRAWRLALRDSAVRLGMLLAAGALGACSMSFPMPGFKAEDATGSVDKAGAMLSPALDREDLRRARAAMSVALDPQGNGTAVVWQNAQSGSKGSFAAPTPPFLDHDRVCRSFVAEITPGQQPMRHVSGSACREADGTWTLRDTKTDRTV